MNDRELIQKYSKIHSKEATVEYFTEGAGAMQIDRGLRLIPKAIIKIWQEAQDEEPQEEAKEQPAPTNAITLKMYAAGGVAVFEYDGYNESGDWVTCRGEIKDRDYAVALARRTAERCNQFQAHLIFEHGREIEADDPVFFQDTTDDWGDFCLSKSALEAVEAELRKARFQQEWDGFRRSWNGS